MNQASRSLFSIEREERVMEYLYKNESIHVADVEELLSVSPSTARILLNKMQDKGLLRRVRGGAVLDSAISGGVPAGETASVSCTFDEGLPSGSVTPALMYGRETQIPHLAAKERIAAAACATVDDGDYISLGSGTTTYLMATHLHGKKDLTVVTDSIPIANELLGDDGITLYVCGGWIMRRTHSCRGTAAVDFFKDIRVDKSYNGADSVDVRVGTTSVDLDPRTENAICHSGRKCYVLADSSKFKKKPYIDHVVSLKDMDVLLTDSAIETRFVKALEDADVEVIVA